jgi:hypothetical protein
MSDSERLRHISGQLRDLASREVSEVRRRQYMSLASECEALAARLKEEERERPRQV